MFHVPLHLTCVLTKGERCVAQGHGRSVVGSVDHHPGDRDAAHACVVRGVGQDQLKLLRQLVLAVIDQLHVARGHADARPEDHAVVVVHATGLVVRAGLQGVQTAALGGLGDGVAQSGYGAARVSWRTKERSDASELARCLSSSQPFLSQWCDNTLLRC